MVELAILYEENQDETDERDKRQRQPTHRESPERIRIAALLSVVIGGLLSLKRAYWSVEY